VTIKVIRGNPTPEELAAALAVVRARAAALATVEPGTPQPTSAWSDPGRIAQHRVPHPSPSAWTRTYWPS
jgi:acyl-CoA carboxylase epsilon subunit